MASWLFGRKNEPTDFARRRWALRVIGQMDLPTRSPEVAELVDMLIQGASQIEQRFKFIGVELSEPELILAAVSVLYGNSSAHRRLSEIGMCEEDIQDFFESARAAGRSLAAAEGYTTLVRQMYDRWLDTGPGISVPDSHGARTSRQGARTG